MDDILATSGTTTRPPRTPGTAEEHVEDVHGIVEAKTVTLAAAFAKSLLPALIVNSALFLIRKNFKSF